MPVGEEQGERKGMGMLLGGRAHLNDFYGKVRLGSNRACQCMYGFGKTKS